ncbi:MAG TPA: hypothetical protein VGB84_02010 [Arachidicoccus sp.]
MQSFIINVPDDKEAFFLELMNQLGIEVLDIDEQLLENDEDSASGDDAFLDWEEERETAKKLRKK